MSIFHVHDWYSEELPDANVCAIGNLIEGRDQLVVGSTTGRLWILDPGRISDSAKQHLGCLLEEDLPYAIVDIAIANFVSGLEQNLIAVLSPQKLIIYRFITDGETHRLNALHEHSVAAVAYNMCIGTFGRSTAMQICVQNLNCSLIFFEAEHQLFHRSVTSATALHPGPILYAPQSDSIISASLSSAVLASYKYSTLATASGGNYGKKLSTDWTFNLGDYPLDLAVIDTAPVQPSIVVLCKRSLFCLTHGGTLRFSIRLQCVATSLLVYNSTPDAYVQLCIATATRMLLFYTDTILIWAAQLSHDPIRIGLCSFSSEYRSMLVILSCSKISVSYLGTEPSLFRLPASQTRFIDFEQRYKEFTELEAAIRKKPMESDEGISLSRNSLSLECSYDGLDVKSQAENTSEEVPSLTLNIKLNGVRILDVKLICWTAFHIDQKYASFDVIDNPQKLSKAVYVSSQEPVYDLRCKVCAFSAQFGEVVNKELKMPLNLMCRTATAQRNAQYKLTIESSLPALEMTQLFPEFETENPTAIGFQPYLSETNVSIYASQKSRRYRIQADSLDYVYLFSDELVSRIRSKQPDAKLNCALPLDHIFHRLNTYAELEKRKEQEEKELERLCTLLRNVQGTILTKLKAERPVEVDHMNTLLDYTHQQVVSCLDRLDRLTISLRSAGQSLTAALNLLYMLASLKGHSVPLDGTIINNSEQSVLERVKWVVSTFQAIDVNADLSASDLRNLLKSEYEGIGGGGGGGGRMEYIQEDNEEEDDGGEPEQPEKTVDPLVSGSLPFIRSNQQLA